MNTPLASVATTPTPAACPGIRYVAHFPAASGEQLSVKLQAADASIHAIVEFTANQ